MKYLSEFLRDHFYQMPLHLTLRGENGNTLVVDQVPGKASPYNLKIEQFAKDASNPLMAMTFSARGSGTHDIWVPKSIDYPSGGIQQEFHHPTQDESAMKRCLEMRRGWDQHLKADGFYKPEAVIKVEGANLIEEGINNTPNLPGLTP